MSDDPPTTTEGFYKESPSIEIIEINESSVTEMMVTHSVDETQKFNVNYEVHKLDERRD